MQSSLGIPEVFLLDAQAVIDACSEIVPGEAVSQIVPYNLVLAIAMRLLLDTLPMVGQLSPEAKRERICTIVNTYASEDVGLYKYMFSEEIIVRLYQWYFQTYLLMFQELEHFFPKFYAQEDGLAYTVKLYGALLRFDRLPSGRNYQYAWDRAT
jgi:hypothetical protein